MSALGKLVVSLSANIAEFTSAMEKAAYISNKRLEQISGAAKVAGAAMGTALISGATAMAFEMRRFIDAADEAGKAAQRVGIAVESLQALQYAADLSGLSAEGLQGALVKLAKGAAEANPAFAAMGISVNDAFGNLKTADVLLAEVAGKFAQYRDGAEKTALATELFGKAGAEMIPMLNSGAEGLAEMAREAESLGLIFGGDVAKNAEAFNDNLTRMAKVKDGIVARITGQMLPALKGFSERMIEAAKNTSLWEGVAWGLVTTMRVLASAGSIVYGIFDVLTDGIASFLKAAIAVADGRIKDAWMELSKGGTDMVQSVRDTVDRTMALWQDGTAKAEKAANRSGGGLAAPIVKAAKNAKEADDELAKLIDKQQKYWEKLRGEGENVRQSVRTPAEVFAEDVKRLQELRDADVIDQETYFRASLEAQERFNAEGEAVRKSVMTPKETLQDRLQYLQSLRDEGRITEETYGRAGVQAINQYEDAVKSLQNTQKQNIPLLEEIRDLTLGYSKSAADAFVQFAITGKNSFSDMVSSILQDIAKLLVYKTITKPLFDVIGSGIDSYISGTRANGGPVLGGRSYLVGERGPELFMPNTSGAIVPNGAMGGSGAQVIVNNYSGAQATATESIDSRGNRRIEVTVGELVAGELRRAGSAPYSAMRSSFGATPQLVGR